MKIYKVFGMGEMNNYEGGVIVMMNSDVFDEDSDNVRNVIRAVFFDNVKLSYGCTEPVAVGLSVATGKKYLVGDLESIEVTIDRNTYKNGLEVGLPGTHFHGFEMAVALAYVAGMPELGLQVFKNVDSEAVKQAEEMKGKIVVRYENDMNLHVKTKMIAGNEVLVEITDSHDNVSKIVVNGKEILNTQTSGSLRNDVVKSIMLDDILEYVEHPHEDVIKTVEDAIAYNLQIAESGMNVDGNFGRALGNGINAYVAAGIDQRMSGELMPVMTVAGSGNQGIACIVPVALRGQYLDIPKEKVVKAVLLSVLVTIYVKAYTGKLTPICGAGSIASSGTAAGFTYLHTDDTYKLKNAINNVLATLFGMTCDGAKRSCALKASIGTQMAIDSAALSLKNVNVPCGNGFAAKDVEETIRRMEVLTTSLRKFDQEIIDFIGHC